MGLCFNCDEQFSRGHKCKQLFKITIVNDIDDDEASLMMITAGQERLLQCCRTMRLVAAILGEDAHMLIDTGDTVAMHNVIDLTFARERRIDISNTIGDGSSVRTCGLCRDLSIRLDREVFILDA